jgi:hypothetical protein
MRISAAALMLERETTDIMDDRCPQTIDPIQLREAHPTQLFGTNTCLLIFHDRQGRLILHK